jgi:hypothetical protein
LNTPNEFTTDRVNYIKSVINGGVSKYLDSTKFGPDDKCIIGEYHIQLFKAEKPGEIAEYILSGFSFEIQRVLFHSNSPLHRDHGHIQGIKKNNDLILSDTDNMGNTFGDRVYMWALITHYPRVMRLAA